MSTYATVSGDTWDMIAFKIYGDEKYAKDLVEANLEYVETVIFSAGVVLTAPDVTTTPDTSSLPPWKQVTSNVST